jgi:hypothetical protein
MVEKNSTLRLVKAPQELRLFHFLLVWHPEAHYGRAAHMASQGGAPSFSSGSIWATSFNQCE